MTVAQWPAGLPKPARSDYQAQFEESRLPKRGRGAVGYRLLSSSSPKLVSMSVKVTRSQKAVFDNFVFDTIVRGTLPFYMPDPTTDGWPMLDDSERPILMPDGTPILLSATWLCLLGEEMPIETVTGVRFKIEFNVKVLP